MSIESERIEELQQQYDKEIITNNSNKDGEKLYILRKQEIKEVFLDISEENIASQAIAKKNVFAGNDCVKGDEAKREEQAFLEIYNKRKRGYANE